MKTTELTAPNGEAKRLTKRQEQGVAVEALLQLLPASIDEERFKAFALAVMRDPNLKDCDEQSKLIALSDCAKLGLYPDRHRGHVWLVPYGKKVTVIPGYQGYIELARRSGVVKTVHTDLVYASDVFRVWTDETGRHIIHEPDPFDENRGHPIGGYCVATLHDSPAQIETMSWKQIMDIKKRSASASGPWKTDEHEMARKSVVRRARKYWPQSDELLELAKYDNEVDGVIDEPPQSRQRVRTQELITDQPTTFDAFSEQADEPETKEEPKLPRGLHTRLANAKTKAEVDAIQVEVAETCEPSQVPAVNAACEEIRKGLSA